MAIYHFSAKVISRAAGSSALASAAYRSASRLHDQRLDRHHNFSNKPGVIHSEVMLPVGAPEHLSDRETLWNAVEAAELRKDAQLAREIEFAIPRELSPEMGIALARDFVRAEFVERGMIADLNVHWDIGADGQHKPHAHVMLTLREVDEDGFGKKNRDWNRTDLLEKWRERWAEHANRRLAELDIDARIDHRSLEAQGIELEPQHKIGPAASRMAAQGLESERVDEHREIARSNGAKIIAEPRLALDAITRTQATFTSRDLAMFVHRHSEGKGQFDHVMAAVRASPELVALGKDGRGEDRFTSRDMIETEQRLSRATQALVGRERHRVSEQDRGHAIAHAERRGLMLSAEQRSAFEHVTDAKDLGVVVGYAGTGKSAMLGVARDAWERAGYQVHGLALSGIAAENLESGSGIASRTIASIEHQWAQDRELLSRDHVLVIDEAGMIGSRQLERVIAEAEKRGSKVVLVGDPEQLQAIEAGAAFRSIAERHGSVEITDVRRQREDWQRDATRYFATGRTGEALHAYEEYGRVHAAETREQARASLVDRWDRDRAATPAATRIILTHTNDEVQALNQAARQRMRDAARLGEDVTLRAERGSRTFASGDRIMFLKNERSMGVKNGSLGVVQSVTSARMAVMLDDGRAVAFDLKDYAQIDHGYAATIHKAQGVTVDRVHVLATPGLDRHAAYVALSRHRDSADLHYGRDDFAEPSKLVRALSRDRAKDMASDYTQEFADRRQIRLPEPVVEKARPTPARDPFAGLDLCPISAPPSRSMFEGVQLQPSQSVRATQPLGLESAVQRFARATADIMRLRNDGYTELPHQRIAFDKASKTLDALRPEASRDLRSAFARDSGLMSEAVQGRTTSAIRAMALEAELRARPANEFSSWDDLAARLRAINIATQNNLCCVFATCFGMWLATQLRLSLPAPWYLVIAPENEISVGVLEKRTAEFYREVFASANITQAYDRVATQWAAAELAYQPELGPAWFTLFGRPIYRPWAIFPWWYHFDAYAPHVFDRAGTIAAASGFVGCLHPIQKDRDGRDPIFRFKERTLVHFAVDPDEVWMATQLKGEETYFMPFNRGYNHGAGNPPVEGNWKTHYLWDETLRADSLLDILQQFMHLDVSERTVETPTGFRTIRKEVMIFPRYHQWGSVGKPRPRGLALAFRRSGARKPLLLANPADRANREGPTLRLG